ncbi:spermatogenesis-associated protein 7 homolog [Halyomorpha halys]|uniref:spermatogenesis-associated protein 7 homolog n=1 Tax=Halyomorpha halys TaxID=286706 RepID=UPI0006D50380|nr:spermatogenesis-associated protein 7 homolog isoform X2 [Halyomorpha halys]
MLEGVYPKSQTGKCMVYFNMSHHYRRIYSAKPRVDTNLAKRSQNQLCCSSPDVFNFVKRNTVKQPLLMTPRHRICTKEKESELFKPKILESHIESKLKALPVYQAPQRIVITKAVQTENNDVEEIPKHEKVVNESSDENDALETERKDLSHNNEKEKGKVTSNRRKRENSNENKFRPTDKLCALFLKDITDDILRKGIYSNESLEKLFTHHISKNKYDLSKEIMEREILRLKRELDMPVESERQESEESIKDEEALTALDSLFLPSDIRDKVASSLGLTKKSPMPLPSPKDSFTGSLEFTSMSEKPKKESRNVEIQKADSVQESDGSETEQASESKEDTINDLLNNGSLNENSVHSTEIGSQDDTDDPDSEKNDILNRTRTVSPALEKIESNNISKHHEEIETTSDLSSIHTESDE